MKLFVSGKKNHLLPCAASTITMRGSFYRKQSSAVWSIAVWAVGLTISMRSVFTSCPILVRQKNCGLSSRPSRKSRTQKSCSAMPKVSSYSKCFVPTLVRSIVISPNL